MPSPGASAPGGELGRTPRKPGGKTRGTPAMGQQSRGASRLQISRFTRCANAYRHKTTHPAAGEATSPAMFRRRKKEAPDGALHAGRTLRRAHPTCIPSHTEPAPHRDSTTRGGAEAGQAVLRRTGGRRATRNEPHAPSHTHPTHATTPPYSILCGSLRSPHPNGKKIFLPTPDSPRTPDSRADSRLAPGLPTPARTPDSPADSRLAPGLPTRPGLPTPASPPDPRLPTRPRDSRLPPRLPPRP